MKTDFEAKPNFISPWKNLKFKARRGFFCNDRKSESFSLNCERTVGDYLSSGLTCTGGSDERENYSNCQHIQISAKYQSENDCLECQQRCCIRHKLVVPLVGTFAYQSDDSKSKRKFQIN